MPVRSAFLPVPSAPRRALCALVLAGLCLNAAAASPDGLLYDPEPPPDSAYVRVLMTRDLGMVDVLVDGKPRLRKLAPRTGSEYMVLSAGRHTVALQPLAKGAPALSTTLEVIRGRAMTLAFGAGTEPVVFEDKANGNKLKALLTVYHLGQPADKLDVLTADGALKVFADLAAGASASIAVNPISTGLIAAKSGTKAALASTSVTMARGGTYSLLLLPGPKGGLTASTMQNTIERYTGK